MERLTKHSKQTSHENGICCTHFRGPECLEVGGNCAMNCKWEEAAWSRLAAYEDTGLEPEEVLPKDKADEIALKLMCLADLESLCSYTRLRELAEADKNGRVVVLPRWKNEEERLERQRLMRIMADGAIDRLMKNPLKEESGPDIAELRVVNTDRLLELAKADEDGRIFLLPMEPGRSMLCQEYFERPWVMKNVTLCVQYQSSAGIILGTARSSGEFICDQIYELETKARGGSYYAKNEDQSTTNFIAQQSCLTLKDMHDYLHAQKGYGWHITDLRIYDAPRELSKFLLACPNSWYCESCAMYWENNGTCGNESLQIKHAPQSWCYVEAMEDV